MRKMITLVVCLLLACVAFSQITIEDTSLITGDRWRDTCFGLIDKSTSLIASGYLIDYSLAGIDKDFNGVGFSRSTSQICRLH